MLEKTVVLTGKVLYRMESRSFWGQKRIQLQILLEDDEEYKKINEVLLSHLKHIGSSRRSSAMPPCITYTAKRDDKLFNAEVGQFVELLFLGRKYTEWEYAIGRGMNLPIIWPELTAIKC